MKKTFENLEKNALAVARKMYNYDLHSNLHDFYHHADWEKQKYIVWIDVTDPRPGRSGFNCWEARGEVVVDADGNKTYKIRFPLRESENKIKYYPCPQTLAGMMHEMEKYRLEFIKGGYIALCNAATEQIIDSLPG